jgi:hypothetical protein
MFTTVFGNDKGDLTAKSKIVGTVQYDAGTDSWHDPNQAELVDPSRHTILADIGTLSGTRLVIESLK